MAEKLIIGTRGSQLALWQANWVKAELQKQNPSLIIDLAIIQTKGDKIQDVALSKVGGKGLFVKEIDQALLTGAVDIAVHSMKDMPAEIPAGLCIGAVPMREHPGDVLISRNGKSFKELPEGAIIGTSSLRRSTQLRHQRPDLQIVPLRGNVDTRLKKLAAGQMEAIVLAAAGVNRLGLAQRITEYLDMAIILPAVGQGALCIEARTEDTRTREILSTLDHEETRYAVLGERAFLNRLEGSCQVPIAAYGTIQGQALHLTGLVATLTGSEIISATQQGPLAEVETLGRMLAEKILKKGGETILDQIKQHFAKDV